MKRFRYIFFAALLAMMWLGINVYADEYDGLDFDYGSVLVQLNHRLPMLFQCVQTRLKN